MIVSRKIRYALFALLFVSESIASVSPYDFCTRSLLDNVTLIANTSFDLRKSTLIAWNNIANDIVVDFLKKFKGVVVLVHNNDEFYNETANSTEHEQFIFFVLNSHEYDIFLQTLIKKEQVSPVRIIVILLQVDDDNNNQILNITLSSYKNDVTDIVVLNCKDKKTVQIITYFPYLNEKHCKNTNPYLLNVNNKSEYFPRKFKNFHGCTIRTSVYDMEPIIKFRKQKGILSVVGEPGIRIMKLLAQVLNASLNFTITSYQGALVQGRWTGSVGDLVNGRTDISAMGAFITHERFQVTQLTYCYKFQKIIWCAPQRREIHEWAKAVLPLFTEFTFLLGVVSVLLLIVSNIARKIEFENNYLHENSSLLWYWAIFLGQQVRCESKSLIVNGMFAMMLGLFLILRIAYQGELSTYLQRQTLEPPYTTLSEAIAGVDAYGGFQSLLQFYNEPDFSQKHENLTLPQILEWLDRISKGERIMVSFEQFFLSELGYAQKVQTAGKSTISAPVGVLVRKRWSAAKEISQAIARITETGFQDKINKDLQEMYRRINSKITVLKDNLQGKAVGWNTLGACFYGLIIGWFVSFTVLFFENVWYKMMARWRNDSYTK